MQIDNVTRIEENLARAKILQEHHMRRLSTLRDGSSYRGFRNARYDTPDSSDAEDAISGIMQNLAASSSKTGSPKPQSATKSHREKE